MAVVMCKRDIEGGCDRIAIRPDLSKLTLTELGGKLMGLDENVMVSHLVLPSGWVATPPYFQLFGIATLAFRESYGLGDVGWSGRGRSTPFVYTGDAIWAEGAFGSRLSGSADDWGRGRILNTCSVNEEKARHEGQRGGEDVSTWIFDRYGIELDFSTRTVESRRSESDFAR